MTPTSPLAGLLTGLLDGGVVAALTFLLAHLYAKRTHGRPVAVHAVAEDTPQRVNPTPVGELPSLRKVA